MYGALSAFLTPSGSHEHDVLLAVVLLAIAAPVAWYAGSAAVSGARPSDPLMLRVIIPNGALSFAPRCRRSTGVPLTLVRSGARS